MQSDRKFYKTVVQVEILSEEPTEGLTDLDTIHYEITFGHWSGQVSVLSQVEINPLDTAKALVAQGSDPEFFMLDENGENTSEYIPD